MKIKLSHYKRCFPEFQKALELRNPTNLKDYLSEYSSCMGIPLIVMYKFVEKIKGESEEYTLKIKELCDFYKTSLEE